MKTVYISEKILESEEFKKSILMDTLPDDVIVKINTHKTSLGNNPSIPDIFDEPFLLKLTEQGFQLSKDKLKDIGEITDVDETELINLPDNKNNVENEVQSKLQAFAIQKVLHEIDEPYREVFMWRVYADLSFKEIAGIFNKNENGGKGSIKCY